ncbi:MAG: M1 family metallopeptidase [Bacteroidetes bacterium]|nr:MAG: M1 family metallopeptidase [Bacteroidota bacterium]
MKKFLILVASCFLLITGYSQPLNKKEIFTKQDTLRGSVGKGRDWWDVMSYYIDVTPDYKTKTIIGNVWIHFKANPGTNKIMQIDLQEPLLIDSIIPVSNEIQIKKYWREGNVYFIDFGTTVFKTHAALGSNSSKSYSLKISYHGKPREARNPPWDGGWIWLKDKNKNPWMSAACQGLGASVWYPCKDHQSDEPDQGASLAITVPDSLSAIGNGRLKEKKSNDNGTSTWVWEVKDPINNYNIIPYIGKYTNWTDTYDGEKGKLDCSYWVLDYNVEKAKKQFGRDVHPMLKAFEYWFGPYPFYEDGFKLVESPHLGMEHQSAVAYGNQYRDGYLGMDLSHTGWGLKWDFIIIHESGHEWFANNITTKDIADMWVHEGFTAYSETLFTEYYYGKEAGRDYVIGTRSEIENDRPVIGPYGVNKEGSGDMYYKGSNMLHTIRQVINDDSLFRQILRGLNKTFYHQTVTSKQVEEYFSKMAKKDLSKIFDQYLRTKNVPVLEWKITGDKISYRWTNCVKGFNMPVRMADGGSTWLYPATEWKSVTGTKDFLDNNMKADRNFFITTKKL